MIALIAFAVVLVLWNVPQLDFILYPVRLFVTFVHEIRACAGGADHAADSSHNFRVDPNGAGVTLTAGGSRLLILPAGYLGAALFGAVLFYVDQHRSVSAHDLADAGDLGRGDHAAVHRFLSTAWLVGLGMALVLLALWRFADRSVNLLVLDVLAILTGLNAVLDLFSLVIAQRCRDAAYVLNDAAAFSRDVAPIVPAVVWAALWALIAVAMLIVGGLLQPRPAAHDFVKDQRCLCAANPILLIEA